MSEKEKNNNLKDCYFDWVRMVYTWFDGCTKVRTFYFATVEFERRIIVGGHHEMGLPVIPYCR